MPAWTDQSRIPSISCSASTICSCMPSLYGSTVVKSGVDGGEVVWGSVKLDGEVGEIDGVKLNGETQNTSMKQNNGHD